MPGKPSRSESISVQSETSLISHIESVERWARDKGLNGPQDVRHTQLVIALEEYAETQGVVLPHSDVVDDDAPIPLVGDIEVLPDEEMVFVKLHPAVTSAGVDELKTLWAEIDPSDPFCDWAYDRLIEALEQTTVDKNPVLEAGRLATAASSEAYEGPKTVVTYVIYQDQMRARVGDEGQESTEGVPLSKFNVHAAWNYTSTKIEAMRYLSTHEGPILMSKLWTALTGRKCTKPNATAIGDFLRYANRIAGEDVFAITHPNQTPTVTQHSSAELLQQYELHIETVDTKAPKKSL